MRVFHHILEKSKSGKSTIFKIYVNDIHGKQNINYVSVSGWRAKIAEKYLHFDQEDWDNNTARKFVGMMILKAARNKYQAIQFLNHVKIESNAEIHFWSYQFLVNTKASTAWKVLNGDVQ